MRTAQFLLSGILLLGAAAILGRLFAPNFPASVKVAVASFVLVWLLLVSFNMWVGVAKAGYAFSEELPVFFMLFLPPTLLAIILAWRLR
jgi:hypothetical protein